MIRPKDFGILVPARLESTRLSRKLLRADTGKPLIHHTLSNLQPLRSQAPLWLVTDSDEIAAHTVGLVDFCHVSSKEHRSGTERIAELIDDMPFRYVLNVQADEPEIKLRHLQKLMEEMLSMEGAEMGTLATPFRDAQTHASPNAVKVLLSKSGRAIYFSRQPLPHGGGFDHPSVFHHIGVYAYRRDLLARWSSLPESRLEQSEKLEQLRALDADINIHITLVEESPKGIDSIEDYVSFVKRRPSAPDS
ncbi:MAG: 3-deoxy-manno-octulosonate cytidylyltransferase [Planctomycetes bacterium]|nr:3-deoxy-manno-octulosonate cytidylyltransferase [Planctomycetota bacterium]